MPITIEDPAVVRSNLYIAGEMPGRHGGRLAIVKKMGSKWYMGEVPRGSPEWRIESFGGEEAARFWEIERLPDGGVAEPDAFETNANIDEFNQGLPEDKRISIRYYRPKTALVPKEYYNKRYLYQNELPIAAEGEERLHDVHYHFDPIVISEEVSRLFRAQRRTLYDFQRFLKRRKDLEFKYRGRTTRLLDAKDMLMYPYLTKGPKEGEFDRDIDGFTSDALGNLPSFVRDRGTIGANVGERLKSEVFDGTSPEQLVRRTLESWEDDGRRERISEGDLAKIKALYEGFVAYQRKRDPAFIQGLSWTAAQYERAVAERMDFVAHRSRELAPK